MGCTIYAASPKALPADEAPGQDTSYQLRQYRRPHGTCSQRIAAVRARSVSRTQEAVITSAADIRPAAAGAQCVQLNSRQQRT